MADNISFTQSGLFVLDVNNFRLTDRFVVPPFSVLDSRQGYWKSRKEQWLSLGIVSELGRGDNLLLANKEIQNFNYYKGKKEFEKAAGLGQCLPTSIGANYGRKAQGTSIFDPVLTELVYRWFCPPNGSVFDPFAGGSVRGIVAGFLGLTYMGMDLSEQQIVANRANYGDVLPKLKDSHVPPTWIIGDSRTSLEHIPPCRDLVFTCPPYFNLEKYSNEAQDISALDSYDDFLAAYSVILTNAASLLANDRFFCIVVGDVRDKKSGAYVGLVIDTISILRNVGLHLYNDAVLLNVAGTLPIRAPISFTSSRKLGKQHQNLLVFYKGDLNKLSEVVARDFDNEQFAKGLEAE